jgi:hypothetical protein
LLDGNDVPCTTLSVDAEPPTLFIFDSVRFLADYVPSLALRFDPGFSVEVEVAAFSEGPCIPLSEGVCSLLDGAWFSGTWLEVALLDAPATVAERVRSVGPLLEELVF